MNMFLAHKCGPRWRLQQAANVQDNWQWAPKWADSSILHKFTGLSWDNKHGIEAKALLALDRYRYAHVQGVVPSQHMP